MALLEVRELGKAFGGVAAIADLCEREDIFLHVDAAYGGSMAVHSDHRDVLDGCDRADAFIVNPHKWLFVPMDCSCLYMKDVELLRQTFSLVPPYLMSPEHAFAKDLMDYGPALGRRFRALKLWMVLRYFGSEGMAERIGEMRTRLRAELEAVGSKHDWSHVTKQIGMFAYTGMSKDMCDELTDKHAIFLTKDGRISIAGLNSGNIATVAKAIHAVTDGKALGAA